MYLLLSTLTSKVASMLCDAKDPALSPIPSLTYIWNFFFMYLWAQDFPQYTLRKKEVGLSSFVVHLLKCDLAEDKFFFLASLSGIYLLSWKNTEKSIIWSSLFSFCTERQGFFLLLPQITHCLNTLYKTHHAIRKGWKIYLNGMAPRLEEAPSLSIYFIVSSSRWMAYSLFFRSVVEGCLQ